MSEPTPSSKSMAEKNLEHAIALHNSHEFDKASCFYKKTLRIDETNIKANHNLGVLLLQSGQPAQAQSYILRALEQQPENEACQLAATEVALELGQIAVAAARLQRGISIFGDSEAWKILANRQEELAITIHGLVGQGKITTPSIEDEVVLEDLLNNGEHSLLEYASRWLTLCYPKNPLGWKALGISLERQGQAKAALEATQQAHSLAPTDVQILFNLGCQYKNLRQDNDAESCYRKALDIDSTLDAVWTNLASLWYDQKNLEEAESGYRTAIAINSNNLEAKNSLAALLHYQGNSIEARRILEDVLTNHPEHPKARFNLGLILIENKDWEQAEEYFPELLITKDKEEAYTALGCKMIKQNREYAAEQLFLRAIEINPTANTHANLGALLGRQRRMAEAIQNYEKSLEINPNHQLALGNLASQLQSLGRWDEGVNILNRLLNGNNYQTWMHSNLLFAMLHSDSASPEEILSTSKDFGNRLSRKRNASQSYDNNPDMERPLRIGFISGDLIGHPVTLFIEPIWANLDTDKFNIYAYQTLAKEDSNSALLRRYTRTWRNVSELDDNELFQQIIKDQIDILIDLSGHTAGNRLEVLARKPAPIQASWIGYPGTTGLESMDYYLVDQHWAPEGLLDDQFVESLVYLPISFTFHSIGTNAITTPPGLFSKTFTFGSFNRISKLTDKCLRLWARVLKETPSSQLLIGNIEDDSQKNLLIERFSDLEVPDSQLRFMPRLDTEAYLEAHKEIDLLLDTLPYSGGTTTNHALWMGVPTLTLAGQTLAGRQGAAILSHLELNEFIAETEEEYIEKAVAWSRNLPELTVVRAGLRARIERSPMRSPITVTRGLERALRLMWQRWCQGEVPSRLVVDPFIPVES